MVLTFAEFRFFRCSTLALRCVGGGALAECRRIRRQGRVPADFQAISAALKMYEMNAGRPPTTEQGLEALVTRPALEPLPEDWVQIAEKVPMDPWRQPYHYMLLSEADGVFRWELRSAGPHGVTGNEDDRAQEFEWEGR